MTENTVSNSAGASRDEPRVAVVAGSTRPTRICPGIACWVLQTAQEESPLRYELIDLAEVNLPFLDEPLKAALRAIPPRAHQGLEQGRELVRRIHLRLPPVQLGLPRPPEERPRFLVSRVEGESRQAASPTARGAEPKGALQLHGVLRRHPHATNSTTASRCSSPTTMSTRTGSCVTSRPSCTRTVRR